MQHCIGSHFRLYFAISTELSLHYIPGAQSNNLRLCPWNEGLPLEYLKAFIAPLDITGTSSRVEVQ